MERKKARPVSPWPALIAVVIALCAGGPAWSHEGHDDGPAQSLVGDPNLVVRSVVNENYEAVVKYHASRGSGAAHLRIYLSDFATNAPVPNARLNLATTAPARIEATAAPVTPGVYEADLPYSQPGAYTLILTVESSPSAEFAISSLPLGQATSATAAAASGPATGARRSTGWLLGAAALIILLAFGIFVWRRRGGESKKALRAAALVTALGALFGVLRSAGAHEGHDAGPTTAAVPGGGPRYVPKESQFLLGVRTILAKREHLSTRLTAIGHVVPEAGAFATVSAPQAGRFERGVRAVTVGDHVLRGQILGYVLVIDRLPIRAPISGLVADVDLAPDQWVQAGQALAHIVNEDRVRVEVPLFGENLTQAMRAHAAVVTSSALPNHDFPAQVRGLAPTAESVVQPGGADANSGSSIPPILLAVNNKGGLLRPGMLVEASLELADAKDVMTVPESAIVHQESGPGVFVHTGPELFALRPVAVTGRYLNRVGIEGELHPGDRVVTEGAYTLVSAPPAATPPPPASKGAHP